MKSSTLNPHSQSRRFLTGLLGAPIAQSAAPAMHERAAQALDLDELIMATEVKRLGSPFVHSRRGRLRDWAAQALDLRCHYQLIEVAGAGREELKLLLEG